MEKTHKYLQLTALVASLLIPCVVLAGYVSHLGYTFAFGLTSELISKGFGDVIAESWGLGVVVFAYLIPKSLYLILAGLAYLLFIYLVLRIASYVQDRYDFKLSNEEITQKNQGRNYVGLTQWGWKCFGEEVERFAKWLTVPLIALIISAFVLFFPYQYGRDMGINQIIEYQAGGCMQATDCFRLIDFSGEEDKVIIEGLLVSANGKRIAFFSGEQLEVYPLLDRYKLTRLITKD